MRLIFVNRFFHPDHSATSQMLSDLGFGLAEKNLEIIVITSRQRYDGPKASLPSRDTANGVRIERIWTSHFGRDRLLFRGIDYLTFYVSVARVLARTARRGDIIIAMTDPPVISAVAALVARWRGARIINWLQDVFPEVAEALDIATGPMSILFATLRRLRNISLHWADTNVAIGERMARHVETLGMSRDRIVVLPNWADTDAICPIPAEINTLRREWNLARKFVVAYSGNLGRAHDIDTLLQAIIAMNERSLEKHRIHWLFVGGGALYKRLERETRQRGCTNVSFYPYQPRERLAESLSVADTHIVSLKPSLEGLIVPSKFYGVAAAGRPSLFIGCPDGEVARLINQFGCGASVAMGDAEALVRTVNLLAQDRNACAAMGERARAMCEENFSKRQAISAWHRLVESVARVNRTPSTPASTQQREGSPTSSHRRAG
ncbi:MAG: glycosyltransferase family 4 protein [Proteobacteria bacterium]|nr:glycosyltransferase family 4 protein [Pseudomonadota bacterium]